MRVFRRLHPVLCGTLCVSLVLVAAVASPQGHPPVTVRANGGPFGTGTYALFSAMEDISKKTHPWLRVNNVETPGLLFNIKKLNENPQNKQTMIIGSGNVVAWLAQSGIKPFDTKYPQIQLLANYFLASVWLATLDPNIKSGADLVGKKIALGRAAQVNWGLEPDWLIRHGWEIRDRVSVQFMGPKEAATALLDGMVDVAVLGGYLDPISMKVEMSPQAVELLASGRKVYSIPWGEEAVRKTVAKGLPIQPFTIPGGTLKGFANANSPLAVFTDTTCWAAAPEFPEELAYEFTKIVINNVSRLGEYVAVGKLLSREALPMGWDRKDIHPGALRAYKEAGIVK